jgi:hypothetical protein
MARRTEIFIHIHARVAWANGDVDYLNVVSPVLDETFPDLKLQYETKVGKHKIFVYTSPLLWSQMLDAELSHLMDSVLDSLADNFSDLDFE